MENEVTRRLEELKSPEAPASVTKPLETPSEKPAETGEATSAKKMNFQLDRKWTLLILLAIVLLTLLYHFRGFFVAATVNGNPISRLSVIRDLEKQSGKQALDSLVTKKLIHEEARSLNIIVSPADIDNEIKTIEKQIAGQGMTLTQALEQQGMSEAELREQIMFQKDLEKLLGDKVGVTDDEANKYIAENKLTPPSGTTPEAFLNQVKDQLKRQKFGTEASKWIADAKAKAKINYFVDYGMPEPVPTTPPETTATPQGQ